MQPRPAPARGWTFDYILWLFFRLSGLIIYLFAIIGLVAALIMGARTQMDMATLMRWMFMPNSNHVSSSNIANLDLGWIGPFWQTMQVLIVVFAISHGFDGLRNVIEDFFGHLRLRNLIRIVIVILWLFSLYAAISVIFTS